MPQSEEFVLTAAVAPGQQIRPWRDLAYDCKISKIIRHWPAGCNQLVDIAITVGNRSVLPETGFVALNDATPAQENINISVKKGTRIGAWFRNRDAANPHTPVVTIFVEEAG